MNNLNEKQTPVIFEPHVNPDVPDELIVKWFLT